MATSSEYVTFVCEQIHGYGDVRCRKMFGEYMVYLNDKPIFTVCDNTVYTGDTLFDDGYGRTDLPNAAPWKIEASVARIKASYSGKTACPGHGASFTI